jgi:hypothetical protein
VNLCQNGPNADGTADLHSLHQRRCLLQQLQPERGHALAAA